LGYGEDLPSTVHKVVCAVSSCRRLSDIE
jgi:hypothetical protein